MSDFESIEVIKKIGSFRRSEPSSNRLWSITSASVAFGLTLLVSAFFFVAVPTQDLTFRVLGYLLMSGASFFHLYKALEFMRK